MDYVIYISFLNQKIVLLYALKAGRYVWEKNVNRNVDKYEEINNRADGYGYIE